MSVVTNIVFKTSAGERVRITELNSLLHSACKFVSCGDESLPRGWYAGTKMLECEIYPGAFNYLDLNVLIDAIRAVEWDDPGAVQLFAQEQEQDRLREIDLALQRPAT